VVDGVDDVLVGGKEVVGFDFLQGLGDGFLAERTSDLLQGKQLGGILILDQVDVGEAALARLRVRESQERPWRCAGDERTSPSRRSSLKLRLLILSWGVLGKQHMQSVKL
jgi:phosphoribosylformylglycinamidine (FGAM) synthase-like enzyme